MGAKATKKRKPAGDDIERPLVWVLSTTHVQQTVRDYLWNLAAGLAAELDEVVVYPHSGSRKPAEMAAVRVVPVETIGPNGIGPFKDLGAILSDLQKEAGERPHWLVLDRDAPESKKYKTFE